MKKTINLSQWVVTIMLCPLIMVSCNNFLNVQPKGTVTASDLTTPTAADNLLVAAYASLGNSNWENPVADLWLWGSIRSDDAFKGGGAITDNVQFNQYEQYNQVTTDMSTTDLEWVTLYAGVARVNTALRAIDKLPIAEYPDKVERQAECRFLRGHFYFILKELFKYVPYITENIASDSVSLISNREYSNDSLWDKIAEDFQFAAANLPATQSDVGRPTKYAAEAYLAKVRLYQAYQQNDDNQVTGINSQDLEDVVTLTNSVISSGKYALEANYGDNFSYEDENGSESIWAIQFSHDDGTQQGRINMDDGVNYSVASIYGCCSFHLPSQNMVNAFKTDADGLPEFGYFNDTSLLIQSDFMTNGIDPRLDWTCAIPGHPFKGQPDVIFDSNWVRLPQVYGYHDCVKEILPANSPALVKVGPFFGSAKDIDIIRYDDVLLWRAEALIQLGQQDAALPLINMLRMRAANSKVMTINGADASNYRIGIYKPGVNCDWTQTYALKALQFERRVEFGMEDERFFDLVRWGSAAQTLNNYIAVAKTRFNFLSNAKFTAGRDEYLPIPQQEINLSHGLYVQNQGY